MFILTSLLMMIIGIVCYEIKGIGIQIALEGEDKENRKEIQWYSTHKDKWVPYCPTIYRTSDDDYYVISEKPGWERKRDFPRTERGRLGLYPTTTGSEVGIINSDGRVLVREGQIFAAESKCLKNEIGNEESLKWSSKTFRKLHYWK